jgi:hypothetical protein
VALGTVPLCCSPGTAGWDCPQASGGRTPRSRRLGEEGRPAAERGLGVAAAWTLTAWGAGPPVSRTEMEERHGRVPRRCREEPARKPVVAGSGANGRALPGSAPRRPAAGVADHVADPPDHARGRAGAWFPARPGLAGRRRVAPAEPPPQRGAAMRRRAGRRRRGGAAARGLRAASGRMRPPPPRQPQTAPACPARASGSACS